MTLPEKIQKLRKERGLSQEQLAEALGIARQSVSKWELGTTIPDLHNLRALCDYFQVSADFLIHDDWNEDLRIDRNPIAEAEIAREQQRKNLFRKLKRLLLYCGIPFLILRISIYPLTSLIKLLDLPIGSLEMILLIPYFCSFVGYLGLFLAGLELWRYFKAES